MYSCYSWYIPEEQHELTIISYCIILLFSGTLPCPVCGDVANGIHYGIYTCESCKSFFKRGVVQQKSYTCSRLTNACIITPNTRTRCPSCRFMKCKLVGMRTELVRMSRERGGRSIVKNDDQTWKLSSCKVYSLKDI